MKQGAWTGARPSDTDTQHSRGWRTRAAAGRRKLQHLRHRRGARQRQQRQRRAQHGSALHFDLNTACGGVGGWGWEGGGVGSKGKGLSKAKDGGGRAQREARAVGAQGRRRAGCAAATVTECCLGKRKSSLHTWHDEKSCPLQAAPPSTGSAAVAGKRTWHDAQRLDDQLLLVASGKLLQGARGKLGAAA